MRVPSAYSTQECYHCGTHNKIDLGIREFSCVNCAYPIKRDQNSAQVVLRRGLAIAGLTISKVGRGTPQLKPEEICLYPYRSL